MPSLGNRRGGGGQRKSVGIKGKLDIVNLEIGERIAVVYAVLAGWQREQCVRFMVLRKKGEAMDV